MVLCAESEENFFFKKWEQLLRITNIRRVWTGGHPRKKTSQPIRRLLRKSPNRLQDHKNKGGKPSVPSGLEAPLISEGEYRISISFSSSFSIYVSLAKFNVSSARTSMLTINQTVEKTDRLFRLRHFIASIFSSILQCDVFHRVALKT